MSGSARWNARLDLHWSVRDRRSTLVGNRHDGPLRVQKPFYPEGDAGHAIVLHPPGGIAGGDDLAVRVRLDDGAHALHTTPGATKWYKANGKTSCQSLNASVGAGAVLEWLPQENIVFDDARGTLSNTVELEPGGVYLGWEVVCLGRAAAGERFDRGSFRLSGDIRRAGRTLWAERAVLTAGDPMLESPLGLGGERVFATFVAAGRMPDSALVEACRAVAVHAPDRGGVSALDDVLVARWIGRSSQGARAWLERIWGIVRPALCGRDACAPRIWST
jgi:urease accessory protein